MKIRRMTGFTLIELMVTVAIVAILAAVAFPSYTDYVRRGKTQEATSALANSRIRMEQYYQDNRTYAGLAAADCTPLITGTKYFTYVCVSDATTFTITATGQNAEGMSGYSYTIDQLNNKTSTAGGTAGATCWITRKGESC